MQQLEILNNILCEFMQFQEVDSIATGGSVVTETGDNLSDIDIYIFVNDEISVAKREKIVKKYSSKYETGCEYFGSGDEFFVDEIY